MVQAKLLDVESFTQTTIFPFATLYAQLFRYDAETVSLMRGCLMADLLTYSIIGGEKRKDVRLRTPFFPPSA
jgi:hypothetical protein